MIEYENLLQVNKKYFEELQLSVKEFFYSGQYISGTNLKSFEEEFAHFLGADYCIGVGSGYDAILLAFKALNLPLGSEIIVPGNSYIAGPIAIKEAGLEPVFVDINLDSSNIDYKLIEQAITKKTKAIFVVHLFGRACSMNQIVEIANRNNLEVIEDCAQAHGTYLGNKHVGTFGSIGCFSFYPTKNLGAFGDAGAIVTNNKSLAAKIKALSNYGSNIKYENLYLGRNSRLDELQAALLRIKLKDLLPNLNKKKQLAARYIENLETVSGIKFSNVVENHSFHIFNILVPEREIFRNKLLTEGVKTEIHYPIAPYQQACFSGKYQNSILPNSDRFHKETLSLPMSFSLELESVDLVCDKIKKILI